MKRLDEDQQKTLALAFVGSVSILAITVFALSFTNTFNSNSSGAFVSTGTYVQYTPQEACQANGCKWTLEIQGGLKTTPTSQPLAVCDCNGQIIQVPLIRALY